jgi:hypothetical protein
MKMKIAKRNLVKNSTVIRAYWIEDCTPVVLYTNALAHDVHVAHLPSGSTEDILRFMQNVDESLRSEVYFVVSDDIKPRTIAYVYFNLPTLTSDKNNKLIIFRDDKIEIIPEIEKIAL